MNETPSRGGSYIRRKDGSLKQVEGTKPAPDRDQKPKTEKTGGKVRKTVKDKSHA